MCNVDIFVFVPNTQFSFSG